MLRNNNQEEWGGQREGAGRPPIRFRIPSLTPDEARWFGGLSEKNRALVIKAAYYVERNHTVPEATEEPDVDFFAIVGPELPKTSTNCIWVSEGRAMVSRYWYLDRYSVRAEVANNWLELENEAAQVVTDQNGRINRSGLYACPPELTARATFDDEGEIMGATRGRPT